MTDLCLLKQCAAEMSQSEERTEAPQYRLPELWRLTCHGHSPSTEFSPPTIRSGPVDEPTFPTREGRPQAEEHTVMGYWFYYTGLWFYCNIAQNTEHRQNITYCHTVVKIQDKAIHVITINMIMFVDLLRNSMCTVCSLS